MALDHGEIVELDGGTLVADSEESPSVVLRLAPWRVRLVARVIGGVVGGLPGIQPGQQAESR
jgi:hypothetical protein